MTSAIRRIAAAAAALLTVPLALVVSTAAPAVSSVVGEVPAAQVLPLNIMPLGDSITVGVGSATRSGWRIQLAGDLARAGLVANFVGSQSSGDGWDTDMEGHVGWGIEQISAHVDDWLATYEPDVILLHIGTNDTRDPDLVPGAPARLSALIDQIRRDRPDAQIFVAKIIDTLDPQRNQLTADYNSAVPGVVASKGDHVHLVDQSSVGGHDLYNKLHPNEVGYDKMAYNWYNALESVYGSDGAAWPALADPYAATREHACTPHECRWWQKRTVDGAAVWQTVRTVKRPERIKVRGRTVTRYRTVQFWSSR